MTELPRDRLRPAAVSRRPLRSDAVPEARVAVADIPDRGAGTVGAQSRARCRRTSTAPSGRPPPTRWREIYAGPKLLRAARRALRVHGGRLHRPQRALRRRTGAWLGTDPIGATRRTTASSLPALHVRYAATPEHQPPRRGDPIAGAAELLRRRAVPRAGRQRADDRARQRRPAADDSRGTST